MWFVWMAASKLDSWTSGLFLKEFVVLQYCILCLCSKSLKITITYSICGRVSNIQPASLLENEMLNDYFSSFFDHKWRPVNFITPLGLLFSHMLFENKMEVCVCCFKTFIVSPETLQSIFVVLKCRCLAGIHCGHGELLLCKHGDLSLLWKGLLCYS